MNTEEDVLKFTTETRKKMGFFKESKTIQPETQRLLQMVSGTGFVRFDDKVKVTKADHLTGQWRVTDQFEVSSEPTGPKR